MNQVDLCIHLQGIERVNLPSKFFWGIFFFNRVAQFFKVWNIAKTEEIRNDYKSPTKINIIIQYRSATCSSVRPSFFFFFYPTHNSFYYLFFKYNKFILYDIAIMYFYLLLIAFSVLIISNNMSCNTSV